MKNVHTARSTLCPEYQIHLQQESEVEDMVVKRGPILANKEDSNFSEALKLYESKQYKKALKLVEQTLKKNSNHAESLGLKGCIYHFNGNKTEAEQYIVKAVGKAPENYLVDHLAGIYYRAVDNHREAAKWFKAAIDNGSPNKQILRDLSVMQVQIRDFKNLKESRQAYLESQPGYRANWTGVAVALHLNKNYAGAVSTLSKIEGIIKEHLQESDMYEHSECVLYKNSIIGESGNFEKALEVLDKDENEIKDKLSFMEYRAKYLVLLNRKKEASVIYRQLLQRNPDNVEYYTLLETALGTSDRSPDVRLKLYEKLAKFYPRSDPPKFLPLTFLPASHPSFVVKAKEYVLTQLQRGVPATFVNVKPLYKNKEKLAVIQEFVLDFFQNEAPKLIPTVTVWTMYFLAQHYLYLNDLLSAEKYIDQALVHSPTLVELYIVKGRVLKHLRRFEEASDVMEEGRKLDLQDRFINSKATKYLLRANKVDEAISCISLFTKLDEDAVNGCKDLHLMQVNWVLTESAEAYSRLYHQYEAQLAKLDKSDTDEETLAAESELIDKIELYKGLALKRYRAVIRIFKIFYEDQFDFHSYCLRRGTPRDYIETLKWEDSIHSTPIYSRVLKGLSQIYFELYQQQQDQKLQNGQDSNEDIKFKKNNKKQKKAKAQNMKKKEDLISRVESEKNDRDPLGSQLLHDLLTDSNGKLLDNLFEMVKPLTEEAKNNRLTWELAFDLYCKEGKYILAMQAIKNLNKVLDPYNEKKLRQIGEMVVNLSHASTVDSTANAAIAKVVGKGLSSAFPEFSELDKEGFLKVYSN